MSDETPQSKKRRKLTAKQEAFVARYLANGFNASEAAHHVSPEAKRPGQLGYEYLKKPEIAAAIAEAMKAFAMPAEEVLARISEHARGTMADFLDDNGDIDLAAARRAGKLHLVKKRSKTESLHGGSESIELYDAQAALALLAKHHGLLGDSNDVLKYLDLSKLSTEQLLRIKAGDDPISVLLNT